MFCRKDDGVITPARKSLSVRTNRSAGPQKARNFDGFAPLRLASLALFSLKLDHYQLFIEKQYF